ncbi:MAG TPA: C25 family cysteine peptidase, partial [Candidatus Polarisedimenticolia bacterium]|nr:C25 family cysteine peptidase [Candidatus Polarisedimenticolia bacterium]
PATMGAATAYLPGNEQGNPPSQAQKDATTDAIIDGMNSGSLVQIYLGHGGVSLWALEKILEHNPNPPAGSGARLDADRLTDSGNLGFLLGLNCINGYFVDLAGAGPGHVDYTLAEEWVRRPNRGAVASWAPSALGQLSDYDSIAYELFNHVFVEGQTTIGPAAVGALVDAVTVFGVSTNNIRGMILFGDPATRLALDSDADGLVDYREVAAGSDPLDADSDDDGLADGQEVLVFGTSPTAHDSDGDGVLDGTEAGVTAPGPGTDAGAGFFVPDSDPLTTTDPGNPDTDGGGAQDGDEDLNANGAVDPGETDPNVPGDDLACPGPPVEVTGLLVSRVGADVVLSWDPPAGVPCATFQVYAAADAPFPKSSIAPFTMIGTSSGASFTHTGAGAGTVDYDYLIVMVHPQQGAGPFGAYGQ